MARRVVSIGKKLLDSQGYLSRTYPETVLNVSYDNIKRRFTMFEKAVHYVKLLPKLIGVFGYAYMHPSVSVYLKATAMAGIVYFFSPMDILPDIFTPVGLIDDLILALLIMQKFVIHIPNDVLQPILDKFGLSRKEILFNVEDAVKETYSAGNALVKAMQDGYDSIIDFYSKRRVLEARKLTNPSVNIPVSVLDEIDSEVCSNSCETIVTGDPLPEETSN